MGMSIGDCHFNFSKNKGTILIGFEFNLQIKSRLETKRDFLYLIIAVYYNSKAFLGLLSHNNSTGFSNASLTATKKPTDSRPSMILWS